MEPGWRSTSAVCPAAESFVAALPVTTSLPFACSDPPGQAVLYLPGFSVTENSLLRPGATFSTSPMMRSPERISNSLTSPEPELVTLNVVGPALSFSVAGQPSSLMSTFTARDLASAVAPSAIASVAPVIVATESTRPVLRNMSRSLRGSAVGSDGFDRRFDRGVPLRGARRRPRWPADVDRHRHRVEHEHEHLAPCRFGLDAEHAGDERRLHRSRIDEPAQVDGAFEEQVPPSSFVCGVHREREESGTDEHEHDAGDAEELREVDLHAAPVDEVA